MKSDQNGRPIFTLCEAGQIYDALEEYILSCSTIEHSDEESRSEKRPKKKETREASFPNLAGFCRFLKTSTLEFEQAEIEYPDECARILTVLEDEALNSGFSPNLISSYLKKRLGYDSASKSARADTQLQIHFEHDIFEDGE